jgi:hypothetical protein
MTMSPSRVVALALVSPLAMVASHATLGCSRGESDGGSVSTTSSASSGASSGASRSTPTGRTSSCDRVTNMSVCSEYRGAYLVQNEAVLSSGCAKLAGVFVAAECPNTSVLGSCTLSTGELRKFYGSGGAAYDAPRAEKECTGPYRGQWVTLR